MKIERTKNATRNIVFGIILKLYQLLVPFLMRTAMIYFMGVEYLGLNSLFTSILQTLNLVELGVGSAMVFSMYKPIAEDDTKTICALMNLYRLYYRVIGGVIAIVGIVLVPVLPYLIKSDLPEELNIYILYLFNLSVTVLSYWLFAYKNALFQAHQRIDVTSKISLLTTTIQYLFQFMVILIWGDYYLYVIVMLLTQVINNIITAIVATHLYPNYLPSGRLERKEIQLINHRIRDLFTSKLGGVIINSADTIVISAFLGLTMLAIYQNYYYLLTAVIGLVTVIFQACNAGIGNSVIVESEEKNFNDLNKFTFLIVWISGICTCCFLCLYQPFIEIWVGKDLMLAFPAVVCFCVYYFVYELNQLLNTFKDAAGIWHEDRFRPLVTAGFNLLLNILTVQFWGIYGVILSTVISTLLVGLPWLLHNLFVILFNKIQMKYYMKHLLKYVVVVIFSCLVCFIICSIIQLPLVQILFVRLLICTVIPNLIYLIAYYRMPEFVNSLDLVDRITKYKFRLVEKFENFSLRKC